MASDHRPRLNQALLSLGSNIEPAHNLAAAVQEFARYGKVRLVSGVWESPPQGGPGQPNYLNAALWLETKLSARDLKETAVAVIEKKLGRLRGDDRFAPRTIDIDITFFNRDRLQLGKRRIPDPEALERPFVAIPMAEIAPDYVHPETGETLKAIAARFDLTAAGMRRRDDVVLAVHSKG